MKFKINIIILLVIIGQDACTKSEEYFIGKWQVVEDKAVIELTENWMYLKSNGTFESYDGNLKKHESGKWTYQPDRKTLIIEGEAEDRKRNISMKNDTLIFQSI